MRGYITESPASSSPPFWRGAPARSAPAAEPGGEGTSPCSASSWHYLEAGRGEPVILLHGTGGEGARWMPTIEGLSADYPVFALDQNRLRRVRQAPDEFSPPGLFAGLPRRLHEGARPSQGDADRAIHGSRPSALDLTVHHPEAVGSGWLLVDGGQLPHPVRSDADASEPAQPADRQRRDAGGEREYMESSSTTTAS